MPIYMDRHDIPDEVTAEHLARMHQLDLQAERQFDCKTMTYWCDEKRKVAFCLVEAPNEQALVDMHTHAHGGYPNKIIEVDPVLVASFLGRIEDPAQTQNTDLLIIDDSAFRILMTITSEINYKETEDYSPIHEVMDRMHTLLDTTFAKFKGRLVRMKDTHLLASFEDASNAIQCAMELQHAFTGPLFTGYIKFKIGLAAGVPVTDQKTLFEDTIRMSQYLSEMPQMIATTAEVSHLYEDENINRKVDSSILVVDPHSESFLKSLMDYVESVWNNPELNVDMLCKALGLSKSQLNRKLKSFLTTSPNQLILEIRLQKSFGAVKLRTKTISEIAYDAGFSSPNYFSRIFKQRFGISPTELASITI